MKTQELKTLHAKAFIESAKRAPNGAQMIEAEANMKKDKTSAIMNQLKLFNK